MFKHLTAASIVTLVAMACSVAPASNDDLAVLEQELNTCSVTGLEWKPFLARMAYDAVEDFGRWEFTTDLQISGDRLVISSAGYSQCWSRGRSGCPSMTAALSAQEGNMEIHNEAGRVIMNPMSVRSQLVNGFLAQQINEQNLGSITDNSEAYPYTNFRSPSRTGLPHSLALTNCAATIYSDGNFWGSSQCLRTGSYRMSDLKVGNDNISSLKVRSGMKVTLYPDDGFAGTPVVLTSDNWNLPSNINNMTSSIVVSQDYVCSAIDSFKVTVTGGSEPWHKIRAKLVTLGYMRGNNVLDVRLDVANNTIDVDPFNVDFIPPSQIGGTTYGVKVKSTTAETWRSTEDPWPSIFPVGSACKKQPYGSYSWFSGFVRSVGSYRYCHIN